MLVNHLTPSSTTRFRGLSTTLILGAVTVVAVAAIGFLVAQVRSGDGIRGSSAADVFEVRRGSFDISIPASGELVAAQQVEIRNRLEARAVVTEIVDEGITVRKGDLLMRLNDEEIRNRIKDAEDAVNTAESAFIAAQATVAIRQSSAESEYDRAQLQVELARLALEAWESGELVSRRKQLKTALETAEINYERLRDRYEKSIELFAEEFISADERERDRIAMIEAQARYEQAALDIKVYENYTYQQEQKQKISDLQQAVAELERVQQRHAAEMETARAEAASREHQLQSRRDRLADLEQQLEYCAVYAPTDGLVVYVTSLETGGGRRWMSSGNDPPQVGTELSRNELVIVLPDTTRMIAAVKVNEALSGLIRPGQRARVTSDAVQDAVLSGEVVSVGVLAESGGWRDPNRRDYTVRIALDGANELGLRPSMRTRADIFVDRVADAVHVPVQAIFRDGRRAHVYVPVGRRGYEARQVTIGRASELYAEILDGLESGDRVLLRRPNPGELVGDAPESDNGQVEAGVQMEEPMQQQLQQQPQPTPQQGEQRGQRRAPGGKAPRTSNE